MTTTTRTTRKAPWAAVLTALLAVLAMVLGVMTMAAPAVANDNPGVCDELDSGKIDLADGIMSQVITAPAGMLIDGYCIKAGSLAQDLGPKYVSVDPAVASMTITYNFTDPPKDISHYSFSWSAAPTFEYTPSATAEETVCTKVDDVWQQYAFGPVTAYGKPITQGTEWTAEEKALEDAKLQPTADAMLLNEESDYDIDRTGELCRTSESFEYTPSATASATACTLVEGTWTAGYPFSVTVTGSLLTKDTPWTTEEKAAEDAKLQTQANDALAALMASATIDGTGANCSPTPPPPPAPPVTPPVEEPVAVTAVEPATVVPEPVTVAPVEAATVTEEPETVAVPAPATVPLPATVPAGDGSTVPQVPVALLALLALATAAAVTSGLRMATNR